MATKLIHHPVRDRIKFNFVDIMQIFEIYIENTTFRILGGRKYHISCFQHLQTGISTDKLFLSIKLSLTSYKLYMNLITENYYHKLNVKFGMKMR